jgi:hypothetical protein
MASALIAVHRFLTTTGPVAERVSDQKTRNASEPTIVQAAWQVVLANWRQQ